MNKILVEDRLMELNLKAATIIFDRAEAAIQKRGIFTFVLAGGQTPKTLYQLLGSEPIRSQFDWEYIHLFWGDERNVPADHPDSNYRMVKEAFLNDVPIPESNVHRIKTELGPEDAVQAYDQSIRKTMGVTGSIFPRFDLILLGLGSDGHTASLFPHSLVLNMTDWVIVAHKVQQINKRRFTLTVPTINNTRSILFLISGPEKANAAYQVIQGPASPNHWPAQLIQPRNGELFYLLDRDAAGLLNLQ